MEKIVKGMTEQEELNVIKKEMESWSEEDWEYYCDYCLDTTTEDFQAYLE